MEHRDTISYFLGRRLPTFSDWWIKIVRGLRTVTGIRLLSYIHFLITAGINTHVYHGSLLVEPGRAIRNATRAPRFVWPFGDSDRDMFASRCDSLNCQLYRAGERDTRRVSGAVWVEDLSTSPTMLARPRQTTVGGLPETLSPLRAYFSDHSLLAIEYGSIVHWADDSAEFKTLKYRANMRLMEYIFLVMHLQIHIALEDLQQFLEQHPEDPKHTLWKACIGTYSRSNSFVNGVDVPIAFSSDANLSARSLSLHPSCDLFRDYDKSIFRCIRPRDESPSGCNLPYIVDVYAQAWIAQHDRVDVGSLDSARKAVLSSGVDLGILFPDIARNIDPDLNDASRLVLCCYLLNVVHSILHNQLDAMQHSLDGWAFDSKPNKVPFRLKSDYYGLYPTSGLPVAPHPEILKRLSAKRRSATFAMWCVDSMASEVDR
jgi:hypothetical protein